MGLQKQSSWKSKALFFIGLKTNNQLLCKVFNLNALFNLMALKFLFSNSQGDLSPQSINCGCTANLLFSLTWRSQGNWHSLAYFCYASVWFFFHCLSSLVPFSISRPPGSIIKLGGDQSLVFLGGKLQNTQSASGHLKEEMERETFPSTGSSSIRWTNFVRKLSEQTIYSKYLLLLLLFPFF